ncbi:hypothetical protein FOL47_010181 [Perkinsus chesapeaki]|uniref:RRM domain-containing protein n=1 Tax=Perkinsus chesapeaki TaxID=330153 RepID=A0A7J6L3G6_PERCH|nr:hypothetical protein FOL47_010181 [Perkinsus chesapeaki]
MDRSNLIVNYLSTSMKEDALFAMFEPYGPIQSVKIVRNKQNGKSMGFGFVNYQDNESACRAIEALNGREVQCDPSEGENGVKRIKVSVGRPAWKANIHSNLYVSGIPTDFTETHIRDALFGPEFADRIENVRMLRETTIGKQEDEAHFRGIAVVRFDTEATANEIIRRFHGIRVVPEDKETTLNIKPWRPECRAGERGILPGPDPFQLACLMALPEPQCDSSELAALSALGLPSALGKNKSDENDNATNDPAVFNAERQDLLERVVKDYPGFMPSSLVTGPDATWTSAMFKTKKDAHCAIKKLNGTRLGEYFLKVQMLPDSLQPSGVRGIASPQARQVASIEP